MNGEGVWNEGLRISSQYPCSFFVIPEVLVGDTFAPFSVTPGEDLGSRALKSVFVLLGEMIFQTTRIAE